MKYEEYVVAFGFVLLSILWLFRVDLNFGDSFSIPGSRCFPPLSQAGAISSPRRQAFPTARWA